MTATGAALASEPLWSWVDADHLVVQGEQFTVAPFQPPGEDHLLVIKTPEMVQQYLDLVAAERPRRIVELGTKEGGSTALLAMVTDPDLIVSVDLAPEVPARLAALIRDRNLHDRVVPVAGLDQGDRSALTERMDALLGTEALDFVVDDASHILGPTRTSLEVLLPRLRPGGIYVVEDWAAEYATACELARHIEPTSPDFAGRLDLIRGLVLLLNSPGSNVPAEVVAALAATHQQQRAARGAGEGSQITDLLNVIVATAATADLTALAGVVPDAPRPLADLAVELAMVTAGNPGVIAEIRLDRHWIWMRRGDEPLPRDGFRLASAWGDHFGYLS